MEPPQKRKKKEQPEHTARQQTLSAFLGLPPTTLSGTAFVEEVLLGLLAKLPDSHKMIGPLEDGILRAPRTGDKGTQLSWTKRLRRLARDTVNRPTSVEWCFLVPANKKDGYHEMKLSTTGSKGKYRTARALHVLVEPDTYRAVNLRTTTVHAIHRCLGGKAPRKGAPCCINPFHIYLDTAQTNIDTHGCKYGAAYLCPHSPICVFTDAETGEPLPCLNATANPGPCTHTPSCKERRRGIGSRH